MKGVLLIVNVLLISGLGALFAAVAPYGIYLAGIWFGKKPVPVPLCSEYPFLSIIIPAFNEEHVIRRRIQNIAETSYPSDCYELIIIDDASTDSTREAAMQAIADTTLHGRVLSNNERRGTNRSFNRGIGEARADTIVTTGADVFFEKDALQRVISRLISSPDIGAVCADMQPVPDPGYTRTITREEAYRGYYGHMCRWESAHDSTFNFNGGLVAFRKGYVTRIRERRGSDDANTAFEVIRSGKRAVYEIDALVYEEIPEHRESQSRQKMRRAKRLIEATLANLDLLRQKRPFSRIFYPLRICMNVLSPGLFILGLAFLLIGAAMASPVLALILGAVLVAGIAGENIVSVFLFNQYYLFCGLLNLGTDTIVWESTSKKT